WRSAAGTCCGASQISHAARRNTHLCGGALGILTHRKFSVERHYLRHGAIVLLWIGLCSTSGASSQERRSRSEFSTSGWEHFCGSGDSCLIAPLSATGSRERDSFDNSGPVRNRE